MRKSRVIQLTKSRINNAIDAASGAKTVDYMSMTNTRPIPDPSNYIVERGIKRLELSTA